MDSGPKCWRNAWRWREGGGSAVDGLEADHSWHRQESVPIRIWFLLWQALALTSFSSFLHLYTTFALLRNWFCMKLLMAWSKYPWRCLHTIGVLPLPNVPIKMKWHSDDVIWRTSPQPPKMTIFELCERFIPRFHNYSEGQERLVQMQGKERCLCPSSHEVCSEYYSLYWSLLSLDSYSTYCLDYIVQSCIILSYKNCSMCWLCFSS